MATATTAHVCLTWTILQKEMDSVFKKNVQGLATGGFYPPMGRGFGLVVHLTHPHPILTMYPLRLKGYMISMTMRLAA